MKPYFGKFRVASPYGTRTDPITGEGNTWHAGVDLVGLDSKAVRAPVNGTVLRSRMVTDRANRTWEWGNYVSVAGEDGYTYYLCHLSRRLVEQGERVRAGQVIGLEGSTGRSTGSHLHFEVRNSAGSAVDPSAMSGITNEAGAVHDGGNSVTPWAQEAVDWTLAEGILLGDGAGDLMAQKPCTREEMAVFLHRLYQILRKEE